VNKKKVFSFLFLSFLLFSFPFMPLIHRHGDYRQTDSWRGASTAKLSLHFLFKTLTFFSYYETLSIFSYYETPSLSLSVRKMFSINKLWTAVRSNADKITRFFFFSPSVGLSSSFICLIACQF
jgi:hypothetical protein